MKNLTSKEEAAINILERGVEYQAYFFARAKSARLFDALKNRGFFNPEKNPGPVKDELKGHYTIPRWPALDYLETLSKGKDLSLLAQILGIIRDVSRPKVGAPADNYFTWYRFVKILSNLPNEIVTIDDIDLVRVWLKSRFGSGLVDSELSDSLLPKLLSSDSTDDLAKILRLISIVTTLEWTEEDTSFGKKEATFLGDSHWAGELLRKHSSALGKKCGRDACDLLAGRLDHILNDDVSDEESYIWRPMIEGTGRPSRREAKDALVSSVRDVCLALVEFHPSDGKLVVSSLIKHRFFTFRRIALHVIDVNFNKLGDIFFENHSPSLFKIQLRHEFYSLLSHHFKELPLDKKQEVFNTISQLTLPDDNDGKAAPEKWVFNDRAQWLHAIKGKGFVQADDLYADYVTKLGFEPEHPDLPFKIETGWVKDESPVSVDEILKWPIEKLVNYLSTFVPPKDQWFTDQRSGLINILREAVRGNLTHFEDSLGKFSAVPFAYLRALLGGIRDRWNQNKDINWEKVLRFCLSLFQDPKFWERKAEERYENQASITAVACELINDGTQNDKTAFDPTLLPIARDVLLIVRARLPLEDDIVPEDAFTRTINTARGKFLEAFLNYSLRTCRLAHKKEIGHSEAWESLAPIYDDELSHCQGTNGEFSAIAGHYLPNFFYLSQDWLVKNIKAIFPDGFIKNRISAFDGMSYMGSVYDPLYDLLRRNGIYSKAVETEFTVKRIRERIVQHIAIGYLRGKEDLKSPQSLMMKLLNLWKEQDIIDLINFFEQTEKKFKEKYFDFWRECYSRISGKEESNRIVLSHLCGLSVHLSAVTEEHARWLAQCAPYVEEAYRGPLMLEQMSRLAGDINNLQFMADTFLAMIKRARPDFEIKHVREVLEKLYCANFKREANSIANAYGVSVKDIYDKFNQ